MFNRIFLFCICFTISLGQEYSYFFDNDNLIVSNNNSLQASTGMTIEAWVRPAFTDAIDDFVGITHYLTLNGPTEESGFSLMYYDGVWRFARIWPGENGEA